MGRTSTIEIQLAEHRPLSRSIMSTSHVYRREIPAEGGGRRTQVLRVKEPNKLSDGQSPIPVVDFSGGLHDQAVNAWMKLFQKNGYPAIKEPAIRLVGAIDVFGRPDIMANLPGYGLCALEIKTGENPTFTDNQRIYIPLLQLGFHVYSIDDDIGSLGLAPGAPFPPMTVFILWARPGQDGFDALKLLPDRGK